MSKSITLAAFVLALALLGAGAWLAVERPLADTPAPEPNDTQATCSHIAIGDTVSAGIEVAGDLDYYCFDGLAGQSIAGDIDSAQAGSPPFDAVLDLYAPNGDILARNDDHDGFDPYMEYGFTASGTYALRVKSNYDCCGGPDYAYILHLTQIGSVSTPTPIPIDNPGNCPVIHSGDSVSDAIDPAGNRDYYCFHGNAGQSIIGDIDAMEGGSGSLLNGVLAILDSLGHELAHSDDYQGGFDPYLVYTLPSTGDYSLRVAAVEHPYLGGPEYTYTLHFTIQSIAPTATPHPPQPTATPGQGGAAGDASCDGHVNSIDAALVLQFGASLLHSLPCASAADVNHDGSKNAIDAALILQYSAGLLNHLPV